MTSSKRVIGTLTLLLSVLLSCSPNIKETVQQKTSSATIIDIDNIPFRDNLQLTDIMADYEYIPLETSDVALVGQIKNIAFDKDRIFIQDEIIEGLHIFNGQGNFLHKMEPSGKGPEEFTEITSFTLDKKKKHIILSTPGKIMTFDYQGNFVDGFNSTYSLARQIAYTGNNKLLAFMGPASFSDEQGFHQAVILDLKTHEVITKDIPFDVNTRLENMTGFFNNVNYAQGEAKLLSIPYKNNIWKIDSDSISVDYVIDFGENNLPENYESEYLTDPKYTSEYLREMETDEGWRKLNGGGLLSNESLVYFYYSTKGKFREVFYDLRTNKAFQVEVPLKNDLDGTSFVAHQGSYEDKLVSFINPATIKKHVASGKITEKRIIQLAKNLKEEDNPVLRLLTFKRIE